MNQFSTPKIAIPQSQPGRALLRGPLFILLTTLVAAAALILITLVSLWLSQAATTITVQGANALTIRAVMRADVDAVGAENLAQRIRQQTPNATMEVITETMGRSLLALQEPWIAKMPDFEVTPLPNLIEIHHPALLTNPAEVQQFVRQLEAQPEVDFVAYNETAHNRLVKLAATLGHIRQHALRWLCAAAGLIGLVLIAQAFRHLPAATWDITLLTAAGLWACGWLLAWPAYRLWENPMIASQEYIRLTRGAFGPVLAITLIITLIAAVAGKIWKCPRR